MLHWFYMSTKTALRHETHRVAHVQNDREHLMILLRKFSDLADDILEEFGELRPEVLASFQQASRDIKRKKYHEIAALTELDA